MQLEDKERRLMERLRSYPRLAVAFSGGVDSTLLLALALEALDPARVIAVLADTPTLPRAEVTEARRLCDTLGVQLVLVPTNELSDPAYCANTPERCYICKKHLFNQILQAAQLRGFADVVDGSNLDDEADYRPGRRALRELEIASPLLLAGLTKDEVRRLSRQRGLPTANKPALACLATRIPFGTPITPTVLRQIEQAEAVLWQRGFKQCRVRHHGELARIEVVPEDLPRLVTATSRQEINAALQAVGYRYVTLDLAGYRMGSLNPAATTSQEPEC